MNGFLCEEIYRESSSIGRRRRRVKLMREIERIKWNRSMLELNKMSIIMNYSLRKV